MGTTMETSRKATPLYAFGSGRARNHLKQAPPEPSEQGHVMSDWCEFVEVFTHLNRVSSDTIGQVYFMDRTGTIKAGVVLEDIWRKPI